MQKDIIHFFLSLHKLRVGADKRANHHIEAISPISGGDCTYELKVKSGGKWTARRMTIGPLGEDSGSKSKCFKVIFDDVLVIKVPPVPITDFDMYVEQIRAERKIADRLSPDIACIVPGVYPILKKIPSFSAIQDKHPDECERQCIKRLRTFPGFQDYLKIGEGFAFFMDLSAYSFLSNVIARMHDIGDKMRHEIASHLDILGDPMSFEALYGKDNAALFFNVDTLYAEFDERVTQLSARHGLSSSIPAYKKKEWCLFCINEEKVEKDKEKLPDQFITDINALLDSFSLRNKSLIARYKHVIGTHVYRKTFKQNVSQLAGIITNILKLLAKLRKKAVAIRDLKPDNLFVVGDLSASPLFLANPHKYSIGLIDFETSVSFEGNVAQPLLGGTPSYSTPSHLFKNETLRQVFGDLPHILHLQDWQAVMSMIYKIITGERIVEKTGKLIPEIIRAAKMALKKGLSVTEMFEQGSRIFWREAQKEFEERMNDQEEMLKAVKITLPDDVRKMFSREVLEERADIAALMREHIRSQKFFRSEKSQEDLMKAPMKSIARLRSNWENGTNVPATRPEIRSGVIEFLKGLEKFKLKSEQKSLIIQALEHENPTFSSHALLEIMFGVVMNAMFPPHWKVRELRRESVFGERDKSEEKEVSQEETIAMERTISL